jgi:tetratricopeptide (TPR) repeat protein
LIKAQQLAPNEWRTVLALSQFYEENQLYDKALEWAKKGSAQFPDNYILAYQLAKNMLISGEYKEALSILTKTNILPNEGASYGRTTYRQACILDAINNLQNNKNKNALSLIKMAREWPENLGVGKPYNTDERIEDYLENVYWTKSRNAAKAKVLEDKVIESTLQSTKASSSDYLGTILMKNSGREKEATDLLNRKIEKEPKNLVAQWNLAKFNGNNAEAENLKRKIETENGGSFFSPKVRDTGFALILAILELK